MVGVDSEAEGRWLKQRGKVAQIIFDGYTRGRGRERE